MGFVPFTKPRAGFLFGVLPAPHERVGLLIATSVPFAERATRFGGDQRLTGARRTCPDQVASCPDGGATRPISAATCAASSPTP